MPLPGEMLWVCPAARQGTQCSFENKDPCKKHETRNAVTAAEGLEKHFEELQGQEYLERWGLWS